MGAEERNHEMKKLLIAAYGEAAGRREKSDLDDARQAALDAGISPEKVDLITRRGRNRHLINVAGDFSAALRSDQIYGD